MPAFTRRQFSDETLAQSPLRPKRSLLSHPFLLLAVACLFVNGVFASSAGRIEVLPQVFLLLAAACILCVLVYYGYLHPERKVGLQQAAGLCLGASCALLFVYAFLHFEEKALTLLVGGGLVLIAITVFLLLSHKMTVTRLILILAAAGFLLRVVYILYTPVTVRQHDVGSFRQFGGHASYIEHFFESFALPDCDPQRSGQFYHPPLHHFLAAMWMRIGTMIGMSFEQATESIQILTLFYSSSCMILFYRLLREFSLKRIGLIVPFSLVCFHPTMILMSGSINNDILCVTFQLAALLATVRWYKKPTYRSILPIALFVGLAMMTKLSGALVAPAVAVVFLARLIQDRHRLRSYIGQFAAFAAVCVPLGLWWSVYCMIRFSMPLTYVPLLSETSNQYLGNDYGVWDRLFDWSAHQFSSPYVAWGADNQAGYFEHNVFLGLLKTSVFGEFTLTNVRTGGMWIASYVLLFVNALVILFSLIAMVITFVRRDSGMPPIMKGMFGVLYLTVIVSYVNFCLQYPHTCTQNFRYAVPTLFVGALCMGMQMEHVKFRCSALQKTLCWTGTVLSVVFCAASVVVYTLLGI